MRLNILLIISLLLFSATQAATIKVSGGGSNLQDAIDNATAGDVIIITDSEEYEQTTIKEKSDLTIVSQAYLDKKSDERFATNMPVIKHQDKENIKPTTDDEAVSFEQNDEGFYLMEEYSTNGALRILKSSNIKIKGLDIDGGGVWQRYYQVWSFLLTGNNAVALFNSGKVTIKGCKIHNAFRGVFQKDRNLAGIFTEANPDDVDVVNFSPAGNPLAMGNHIVEQNMIYDNHWGIMFEILWDAASTYRNNLIFNNGLKNPGYVVCDGEQDGVQGINWTQVAGGAVKVHGVEYVSILFQNNTFYKNMMLFSSHWGDGGPNFRLYNNLFAESDDTYYDDDDVWLGEGFDLTDYAYEGYFRKWAIFERSYIGMENFKYNTIAKQWSNEGEIGYVAYAKFDDNGTPEGGELLSTYTLSDRDALGDENYYLGKDGTSTFESTDMTNENFLEPKSGIAEIKDRGARSLGFYDVDGSKADVGAIDVEGNWAGLGAPITIYDKDRFAVVNFDNDGADETSSVNIRFLLEYNQGKQIDKVEYIVQEYSAEITGAQYGKISELPETHSLDYVTSNITEDDMKNRLSYGETVEIRYFGKSPEFNKDVISNYARYFLQVKITDVDGDEFYSNVGVFDYRKVEMGFNIELADVKDDNSKGESWEYGQEIKSYTPFWMSIEALNYEGEEIDMSAYNGSESIFTQTENSIMWEHLWKWNSDESVDPSAIPGVDERWYQMNGNSGTNYLDEGWSMDGTYEGIFVFTRPSQGTEYLRANMKGAASIGEAISGTSVGFKVTSTPDSIYWEASDYAELLQIDENSIDTLIVSVFDAYGYLLPDTEVSLSMDESLGWFLTLEGEMSDIKLTTDMYGHANVIYEASSEDGSTGEITATVTGIDGEEITADLNVAVTKEGESNNSDQSEGEEDDALDPEDITSPADSLKLVDVNAPSGMGLMFPGLSPYIGTLYVNSFDDSYDFRIGPNPVKKDSPCYIYFTLEEEKEVIISIYDMSGKDVVSFTPYVVSGDNVVELPVGKLDAENYIMFMKYDGNWVGSYFFIVK